MAMQDTESGSLEELREILKGFDTVMLVTVDDKQVMHARPMALQELADVGDADLWLVTAPGTHKVEEIKHDGQVCVCAYREKDRAYVSISARARLERNPAEVKRLWKADWKIWFDDEHPEEVLLIKLDVLHAEYWLPEGGRLKMLFSMAKGLLGKRPAQEDFNPPKRL
jgi:general stress protein 26